MKHIKFFIYLLFFILLTSCSASLSAYNKQNYEKAITLASIEKNPDKNDYYAKAMSLAAIDKKEEAKDSLLIYLLMSDDQQYRQSAANLFVDLKFSDYLNVLALRPSDGLKAQVTLYKAFYNFRQVSNAKEIVELYLRNSLNISDLITLMVSFPFDFDYISTEFINWSNNLNDEEISKFLDLLLQFSKYNSHTQDSAKILLQITSKLNSIPLNQDLCKCYWIIGNALDILNDNINARKYWKAAYNLNPQNKELEKLAK